MSKLAWKWVIGVNAAVGALLVADVISRGDSSYAGAVLACGIVVFIAIKEVRA